MFKSSVYKKAQKRRDKKCRAIIGVVLISIERIIVKMLMMYVILEIELSLLFIKIH